MLLVVIVVMLVSILVMVYNVVVGGGVDVFVCVVSYVEPVQQMPSCKEIS